MREVPEGWDKFPVGEIANIKRGITYVASELTDEGSGKPLYVNMKSFKKDGGYNPAGEKYFGAEYQERDLADENELFIANTDVTPTGDIIGAPALVPEHRQARGVLCSHHVSRLQITGDVEKEFFYHLLCADHVRRFMKQIGRGTTVKMLDAVALKQFEVPIPPIPEQQKIAAILSSVDTVIEKTRAQIDKLKAFKTGMMQELLTKGIGTNGQPHTEFKDSPVGRIPVGWNARLIGDLLEFKNGLNKGKEFFGYGNPIVNFNDVFHLYGIGESDLVGRVELTDVEQNRFRVRYGDVFFTRTSETPNEIGMAAVFLDDADSVSFSGFVLRGRPITDELEPEFCKYCFASEAVRGQIVSSCSYTTRALTNGTLLSACWLAVPPRDEQIAITKSLDAVRASIEQKSVRLKLFGSLKKALMQDLLTGKVRVNVDQAQEAVVA